MQQKESLLNSHNKVPELCLSQYIKEPNQLIKKQM